MIRSLRIENFKCFKDEVLDFGTLTILSGANGVGKSTVLQSLLLLRETNDRVSEYIVGRQRELSVRLNGPYALALGNSRSVTNVDIESSKMALSMESTTSRSRFEYLVDVESSRTTIDVTDVGSPNDGEVITLLAEEFHYLVAERVGPRDLYAMADQTFISTGFQGEFTAQAIHRAESSPVNEALCLVEGTSLFRVQLEAWLEKIVPGIQITTSGYPEVNRMRVGIRRRGAGTDWLSPSNIGFGISYVIPVIVSGLLAKPGTMFIVENPEAHLHPAAQSAIGQFLARVASSGVQVVVETHSENVVNGARLQALRSRSGENDLRFLFFGMRADEGEPQITSIGVDDEGELSDWPLGFFDQQSRDLADLFRIKRERRGK